MTSVDRFDRFEQRLPVLFDDLAAARPPEYLDAVLDRTAGTRQRPRWAIPERWAPMSAISERVATAPRFPGRALVAAALIILAIVAGIAIVAGSQHRAVPAPFGPASNGTIAFADSSGSIVIGDPTTGDLHVALPGPGLDRPVFSPDGTRLAYLRPAIVVQDPSQGVYGTGSATDIVVADAAGRNGRVITPVALVRVDLLAWTPDGKSVAVMSSLGGSGTLQIYDASQATTPRTIANGLFLDPFNADPAALYRPPSGDAIVYLRNDFDLDPIVGLYIADADGKNERPLVTARSNTGFDNIAQVHWSPDGSKLAFMYVPKQTTVENEWHIAVMNADGTGFHEVGALDATHADGAPAWSPDGTKIAVERSSIQPDGTWDPSKVTVIDLATDQATSFGAAPAQGFVAWGWSPDGRSILEVPRDDRTRMSLVDIETGDIHEIQASSGGSGTWSSSSPPTWQRSAG